MNSKKTIFMASLCIYSSLISPLAIAGISETAPLVASQSSAGPNAEKLKLAEAELASVYKQLRLLNTDGEEQMAKGLPKAVLDPATKEMMIKQLEYDIWEYEKYEPNETTKVALQGDVERVAAWKAELAAIKADKPFASPAVLQKYRKQLEEKIEPLLIKISDLKTGGDLAADIKAYGTRLGERGAGVEASELSKLLGKGFKIFPWLAGGAIVYSTGSAAIQYFGDGAPLAPINSSILLDNKSVKPEVPAGAFNSVTDHYIGGSTPQSAEAQ